MGLMQESLEFFVSRWLRVRRCCYNRTLVYVRLGVFLSGIFCDLSYKIYQKPFVFVVFTLSSVASMCWDMVVATQTQLMSN